MGGWALVGARYEAVPKSVGERGSRPWRGFKGVPFGVNLTIFQRDCKGSRLAEMVVGSRPACWGHASNARRQSPGRKHFVLPGCGLSPNTVQITRIHARKDELESRNLSTPLHLFEPYWAVPENLVFLFLRAACGGAQEMRRLGHSPR